MLPTMTNPTIDALRQNVQMIQQAILKKHLSDAIYGRRHETKRRLGVMAGLESPSQEDITQFSPSIPKRLGVSKQVGTMPGATYQEGEIFSPSGERIGEYLPGYEPKTLQPTHEDVAGAMRKKFAPGISKEDLSRTALGVPFSGRVTSAQVGRFAKILAGKPEDYLGTGISYEEAVMSKMPLAEKILKGEENIPQFNSIEEAEQANLPPGTTIMIGGRIAIVE